MTRVLEIYEGPGARPSEDLAFEAWLLERAAGGSCCLFLNSWPGRVVVLGYAQPVEDADLEWCRDSGIPVLRRLTGGTGVIHDGDLGLSLALPQDHQWAKGVLGLYDRFLDVLEPALNSAGGNLRRLKDPRRASRVRSPICFEDRLSDTLTADGRKAVGCAQTRRRGAVLIHAAVLLGLDPGLYARVFHVDEERVRRGLAPAVPGGDWRRLGRMVSAELAAALELEPQVRPRQPTRAELLLPWSEPRWAPVPDDI